MPSNDGVANLLRPLISLLQRHRAIYIILNAETQFRQLHLLSVLPISYKRDLIPFFVVNIIVRIHFHKVAYLCLETTN